MNNIRKIIEERLENAKIDLKCNINLSVEDVRVLQGQIEAYQDCLNLIPAPRTEQDILKDFEKLEKENQEYFEIITKQAYLLNNKHIDKPIIEKLMQENEKLKNVVEIFSKYCYLVNTPNTEEYFIESADYIIIPKKEVETLKEVLGDE